MKAVRALSVAFLLALPASADSLWFHLRVDHKDGSDKRVTINLPLRAITRAMAVTPDLGNRHCEVRFEDSDVEITDLRRIVAALQAWPKGSVTMRRSNKTLVFRRAEEDLLVEFEDIEDGPHQMRLPFGLASSLVAGNRDSANLRAAAAYLERRGEGDLVLVAADRAQVRMWVDDQPASGRSW